MVRHTANHGAGLDRTFHVLADPARRSVMESLADRVTASVTELAAPFPIGHPTFLMHLQVLEGSGLVSSVKTGRVRTCRIRMEHLDDAERWLVRRHRAVHDQIDHPATYVESIHRGNGATT